MWLWSNHITGRIVLLGGFVRGLRQVLEVKGTLYYFVMLNHWILLPVLVQNSLLTLLKTNSLSLYRGFMPLAWTVFVLNLFLIVSVGKPYRSTSTWVVTFLSDKNIPEIIWKSKPLTSEGREDAAGRVWCKGGLSSNGSWILLDMSDSDLHQGGRIMSFKVNL